MRKFLELLHTNQKESPMKKSVVLYLLLTFTFFALMSCANDHSDTKAVSKRTPVPESAHKLQGVVHHNLYTQAVDILKRDANAIGILKIPIEYKSKALITASRNGNTKMVQLLLKSGANINYLNIHSKTPLIAAAGNGHINTLQYLLWKGANIEAKNDNSFSPLMVAARNNQLLAVKILIARGANPLHRSGYGKTAYMVAPDGKISEILKEYEDKKRSEWNVTIPTQ